MAGLAAGFFLHLLCLHHQREFLALSHFYRTFQPGEICWGSDELRASAYSLSEPLKFLKISYHKITHLFLVAVQLLMRAQSPSQTKFIELSHKPKILRPPNDSISVNE